jgi:hypothetical protein
MSKWILTAGAAAIALTVPALAGPGHGGGPKEQQGGGAAKVERGGGDKAARGQARAAPQQVVRAERRQAERGPARVERQANRVERQSNRVERQAVRAEQRDVRGKSAERQIARLERGRDKAVAANRDLRNVDRGLDRRADDRAFAGVGASGFRGLANGCPPGLAMKNNGCLPPGQAKKLLGAALPASLAAQALAGPFSQWYRDDERFYYRGDGDYIYRVNREGGLIDALFPSQDRDYSYYPIGMTYPAEYNSYNVPYQYRSFYPDGGDYDYRYGDGAIYQVNRSNSSVESIVALLAGDLGVGQTMPSDYGVYNVPMAYRDRYYDTPEAMYRYNDGYIYQADPKTQLITAVIDALV